MHTAFSDAGIAPTTSNKEEIESTIPFLSENGVKIHIGKGMLGENTIKQLDKYNSIFVITPPVAALLTSKVLEKKCVLFENEGMEAMFELKVENIPGDLKLSLKIILRFFLKFLQISVLALKYIPNLYTVFQTFL